MAREGVLEVSEAVAIPRAELEYRASRAGGAGGQHVNTSSTRIELLWNVRATSALDEAARLRVAAKLASRLDGDGWIRVVSSARRSQGQNRDAAEARLAELVRAALVVPKRRKATKPSRGAKEARLSAKKKRGDTKRQRRPDSFD
jgi:ribosome-associated protein